MHILTDLVKPSYHARTCTCCQDGLSAHIFFRRRRDSRLMASPPPLRAAAAHQFSLRIASCLYHGMLCLHLTLLALCLCHSPPSTDLLNNCLRAGRSGDRTGLVYIPHSPPTACSPALPPVVPPPLPPIYPHSSAPAINLATDMNWTVGCGIPHTLPPLFPSPAQRRLPLPGATARIKRLTAPSRFAASAPVPCLLV